MSPTGRPGKNSGPGFTLVELLVVIFIVGLFSALVSIRIEGALSGGDLRLASRIIAGQVAGIRGKAAAAHREQVLGFDFGQNALRREEEKDGEAPLSGETPGGEAPAVTTMLPPGTRLEDITIGQRGTFREGTVLLRFFANGCVEPALIHLRNEKDRAFTLRINPVTGRVRVYDRHVEEKTEP